MWHLGRKSCLLPVQPAAKRAELGCPQGQVTQLHLLPPSRSQQPLTGSDLCSKAPRSSSLIKSKTDSPDFPLPANPSLRLCSYPFLQIPAARSFSQANENYLSFIPASLEMSSLSSAHPLLFSSRLQTPAPGRVSNPSPLVFNGEGNGSCSAPEPSGHTFHPTW